MKIMKPSGWIVYNGNLPGQKFLDFAEMIQEAGNRKHSETKIYKNNDLLSVLGKHHINLLHEDTLSVPDYVVFTDKDIYLARSLELLNIAVFNSAQSIAISDDKIATYQMLAARKLPIPKTIIAPKVFIKEKESLFSLENIVNELGLPLIVKEAFGSFGEQVYLIQTMEELKNKTNQLHGKAYMFQEFIKSSYGRDIRLQVVGDKVAAAMLRTSEEDFRANITSGGKMSTYEPTEEEKQLAIAGTKAIGADFAGVDLLFGEDGPVICEINSNAHIRNLYEATNINVADDMIDYILKTLNKK
ncbi:MAG TPA: RimK family alpha-L-glutamate ligase [Candidatus Avamphibacillus sp.]|nr:RimK family alpha-L-glutamate ligase [Candidatus Avamphibacillus sp.]